MDDAERRATRAEILAEITPLLETTFVAAEWGRLLVRVTQLSAQGSWVVEALDVEELHGDEARVEQAFGSEEARASLPVLAAATEALTLLDGLELSTAEGGTFVRTVGGGIGFLPGLVRTPSRAFDERRDGLISAHRERSDELYRTMGLEGAALRSDHHEGTFAFVKGGEEVARGRHAVIGTFSRSDRMWAWGAYNPTLSAEARTRSASLIDTIVDRTLWEISTPAFPADEDTARALAAFVWGENGGAMTVAIERPEGAIYLLLHELHP